MNWTKVAQCAVRAVSQQPVTARLDEAGEQIRCDLRIYRLFMAVWTFRQPDVFDDCAAPAGEASMLPAAAFSLAALVCKTPPSRLDGDAARG